MAGMTKSEREAAMRRLTSAARPTLARADAKANRVECERLLRQWNPNIQRAEVRWSAGVLATADALRRSGSGFRISRSTLDRSGGRLVVTVEAVVAGYASTRSLAAAMPSRAGLRSVETRDTESTGPRAAHSSR